MEIVNDHHARGEGWWEEGAGAGDLWVGSLSFENHCWSLKIGIGLFVDCMWSFCCSLALLLYPSELVDMTLELLQLFWCKVSSPIRHDPHDCPWIWISYIRWKGIWINCGWKRRRRIVGWWKLDGESEECRRLGDANSANHFRWRNALVISRTRPSS